MNEQMKTGSDRVVVVGSINLDHTVRVDRFPRAGETLLASSSTSSVGGKGANQAVAAAKSGAEVRFVGTVGADPEGAIAIEALQGAGVDTSGVRRLADARTGSAWITVAAGENTILVAPGANSEWSATGFADMSDVVLCQLEIPVPIVEMVAAATRGTFVLNAAPATPLSDALLQRCDVLIVNEHELAELTDSGDLEATDPGSVVAACQLLLARGCRAVVTTLGAYGAIACTAESVLLAAPPPTPLVVDSTGAGDALCGVFAARLAAGESLGTALRAGVTAGSIAVRSPTAQGGYDAFGELDAALPETPEVTVIQ